MRKSILLIIGSLFACVLSAQEKYVMVVNYNDGNQQVVAVDDVSKIDFVTAEESPVNTVPVDITRGLELYYSFDSGTLTDQQNNYQAFDNGCTFIYETPSGDGRALLLRKGQYISIGAAPLDEKNYYTVSFWIKDFGAGCVMKTRKGTFVTNPSLFITEDMKLHYYTGQSNYDSVHKTFAADFSNYQQGEWMMVTVVTEYVKNNQMTNTLYVNGRRVDASTSNNSLASGGTAMEIGGLTENGKESSAMKIDNIRIYSTALSDDEVSDIYKREKAPSRISVEPQIIYFDSNTDLQTMTLKNATSVLKEFSISEDVGILNITPAKGYVPVQGTLTVNLQVYDRATVPDFLRGSLSLNIDGTKYNLPVTVERGSQAPAKKVVVPRGLMAYYTMDQGTMADSYNYGYDGTVQGASFVEDTPSQKGKSLQLSKGATASVAAAPVEGKSAYSLSFWVKDFGAGCCLKTIKNKSYWTGPSLFITEDMRLRYYTGQSNYDAANTLFSTDLSRFQFGTWVMITVVTESMDTNGKVLSTLYINGQRADAKTSNNSQSTGAVTMEIGGMDMKGIVSDPMLIDNVRLYGTALTDAEVAEIYAAERQ